MNGKGFLPRQFTLRLLALSVAAAAFSGIALAADSPMVPMFRPITDAPTSAPGSAPMTPQAYQQLQTNAPEQLTIRIVAVKTTAAKSMDKNTIGSGALLVTARAAVVGVAHTSTNLKIGDAIYLYYGYAPLAPGAVGSAPIPVIKEGVEYKAYLGGGKDNNPYGPVAGAQSFIDTSAPASNATGAGTIMTKPTGPIADPTLLPSPDNPAPHGIARLTKDTLAQFAKASQTDGHWSVSIIGVDNPLPLQTTGQATPMLLTYYPAPARAPATQPSVLVYESGTQPDPTSGGLTYTVERALIIDSQGHALGDTVWALRASNPDVPVPLPVWHWSSYKLDIEHPPAGQTETILLMKDAGGK